MTDQPRTSPKIADLAWARVELEDGSSFKDVKLWPGGAREWDWNETDTRHSPGIQPADVQELLEKGAEVVVLGRGVHERLLVQAETLDLLEDEGIPTHVLQTEEAVRRYNELRESEAVGALIHSTC